MERYDYIRNVTDGTKPSTKRAIAVHVPRQFCPQSYAWGRKGPIAILFFLDLERKAYVVRLFQSKNRRKFQFESEFSGWLRPIVLTEEIVWRPFTSEVNLAEEFFMRERDFLPFAGEVPLLDMAYAKVLFRNNYCYSIMIMWPQVAGDLKNFPSRPYLKPNNHVENRAKWAQQLHHGWPKNI